MSRGHEKGSGSFSRESEFPPTGICRESEFPPTGVCRESEFPPTEELNDSAANHRAIQDCRESEFPPTEELNDSAAELNDSAAKQVSICKLCRKRAMMLSNPISLHVP